MRSFQSGGNHLLFIAWSSWFDAWCVRRYWPVSNDSYITRLHVSGRGIVLRYSILRLLLKSWWQCLPKKSQWDSSHRLIVITSYIPDSPAFMGLVVNLTSLNSYKLFSIFSCDTWHNFSFLSCLNIGELHLPCVLQNNIFWSSTLFGASDWESRSQLYISEERDGWTLVKLLVSCSGKHFRA